MIIQFVAYPEGSYKHTFLLLFSSYIFGLVLLLNIVMSIESPKIVSQDNNIGTSFQFMALIGRLYCIISLFFYLWHCIIVTFLHEWYFSILHEWYFSLVLPTPGRILLLVSPVNIDLLNASYLVLFTDLNGFNKFINHPGNQDLDILILSDFLRRRFVSTFRLNNAVNLRQQMLFSFH